MSPQIIPRFGEADLTNCDSEPIHIPGSIQPHGALLAFAPSDTHLAYASENALGWLGLSASQLFSTPLATLVAPETLNSLLQLPEIAETQETLYQNVRIADQNFAATIHRHQNTILLEFEPPDPPTDRDSLDNFNALTGHLARIQRANTLQDVCNTTVQAFRQLTGIDRVMMYRFDPDWNGEVIAEEKIEALEPYLGLRYPASDIPRQARELYTRNLLRFVPNVAYTPIRLIRHPDREETTLDMSYSILRSVSPIHIEYMKNMGVGASLVASVLTTDNQQLWGLITCNHNTSHPLSRQTRFNARLIAQLCSERIAIKQAEEERGHRGRLQHIEASLIGAISTSENVLSDIQAREPDLLALTSASGAAVYTGETIALFGKTPSEQEVKDLIRWLDQEACLDSICTSYLSHFYKEAASITESASGLIAVPLGQQKGSYLLWFRREVVQTVSWGGDPSKSVASANDGGRISPRKSFARWQETLRGHSLAWEPVEYERAAVFGTYLGNRLNEERRRKAEQEVERLQRERAEQIARDNQAQVERLQRELGIYRERETETIAGEKEQVSLREAQSQAFLGFVEEYSHLLELALEERGYRVDHNLRGRANDMAERLGVLNARANDVVDIYTESLRRKTADVHPERIEGYLQEGRILSLAVMGFLLNYFRRRLSVTGGTPSERGKVDAS